MTEKEERKEHSPNVFLCPLSTHHGSYADTNCVHPYMNVNTHMNTYIKCFMHAFKDGKKRLNFRNFSHSQEGTMEMHGKYLQVAKKM